jgi:hypothetical protein
MSIDTLKDRLPDYAGDIKLNLSSLASEQLLSPQQKGGSFIAAALAANPAPTTQAIVDAFASELTPEALNAIKIAATLMAMNNIYYRFVHLVHAADYNTLPAKLRMVAGRLRGQRLRHVPREPREGAARARPLGRAGAGGYSHRSDCALGSAHAGGRRSARLGAGPSGVSAPRPAISA